MNGEIIVALITGGAFTAIIKGIVTLIQARINRKDIFYKTISDLNSIYEELDELKAKSGCDRVLIISTQNGGGVPIPGAELYANILFETYDKSVEAIKSSWQNRLVDEAYVKMLLRLEKDETFIETTDNLEDGLLKDIYNASGVKKSVVAKIKSTDKKYYYIACTFNCNTQDEVATKVHVLDAIAKIRDIL